MSLLPIQTTARFESQWISEINVILYSLASINQTRRSKKEQIIWMADMARKHLPDNSYL